MINPIRPGKPKIIVIVNVMILIGMIAVDGTSMLYPYKMKKLITIFFNNL